MARVVVYLKVNAGAWLEKSATSVSCLAQHNTVTKGVDICLWVTDALLSSTRAKVA